VRRPVAAALHSSAIIGALAVDGLRLLVCYREEKLGWVVIPPGSLLPIVLCGM